MLKKRDRITRLVGKCIPTYLKRRHKFGIEMPTSVTKALELDRKNGTTFLANAIAIKMKT